MVTRSSRLRNEAAQAQAGAPVGHSRDLRDKAASLAAWGTVEQAAAEDDTFSLHAERTQVVMVADG